MRKKNFLLSVVVTGCLIISLAGCGSKNDVGDDNGGNISGDGNSAVDVGDSVSEDYFEWDGNIIAALTDAGAKQESLVIPARCEGFYGMIFGTRENDVRSVSFESDKDIDLNGVFKGAENLTSISLPAELTEMEEMEFWFCSSLTEITIPAGVAEISPYAFQEAAALTSVTFQGDCTEIGAHAFDECVALENITLPDTITTIGEYAFSGCDSLESVTLPSGLTRVEAFAFSNNGLTTVTVPGDVTLEAYDTTSFVQADHEVTINVVEGSWMDTNFESVFSGAFIKNYSE